MRILRIFFNREKTSKPKSRFLLLAALLGFMVVAQPQPAQAQWIVADPGQYVKEALQWAKEALEWIAQKAEWLLNHFLLASGAVGNNIAQMAQSQGHLIVGQAQVDATLRVPYMVQTSQITVDATMLPGSKWCYLTMETSALDQMEKAKAALLGALGISFSEIGAGGNDPNAKLALLKGWCDSSFVDPTAANSRSGGQLLQSLGCAAPAYPQFVGKDSDIMSVVGVDEMYFPQNTKQSTATGRLTLPPASSATVKEMPAIAALYYCMNRHSRTATPVTRTGGANLTNATEFVDQRLEKMNANTPSQSCLEQVTDRMAVGQNAPGAQLKSVYEAQASLCLYMSKTGKITAAENTACQSDGMSYINAKRHFYCRSARPDYVNFRAGQGAPVNTLTDELNQGSSECMKFKEEVQVNRSAFVHAMQQVESGGTTTERPDTTAR